MCGRYARTSDKQAIAEAMHADVPFEIFPSYNVAPGTFQPVIRVSRDGGREAAMMRWGLVPFWAKDSRQNFSTINARAETVTTAATYREAMRRRRCLVPANAFYEWNQLKAKTKQAFAISAGTGPFAFAGLWESWKDRATGEQLETFTIITTDANELMTKSGIHTRMPVILEPSGYQRWLFENDLARLPVDLLRPYDADKMQVRPVSARVGNVKNDDPELLVTEVEPTLFGGPNSL